MSGNENNYVGATTTLVGYTASEARAPRYDKDGTSGVIELPIPINEGYTKDGEFVKTGTTWYNVVASGEYADQLRAIPKGSKVRIDNAKQEVREYQSNGVTKLGITLRFGSVTVLEAGNAPAGGAGEEPF